MINYKTFKCLYNEALEYNDFELYVAERGWQSWMDAFDVDTVVEVLDSIYKIAREPLRSARERLGYSRAEFSRVYEIHIRTVEDWESNRNHISKHTETLIKYTLFVEEMSNNEEKAEE